MTDGKANATDARSTDCESAVAALCRLHADEFRIRRLLHAVPPHCVAEVEFAGQRAVCKLSVGERGRAGVEGRVLRHVDRETTVPVPAVLATDDAGFVAEYRADAPTTDRSAVESALEPVDHRVGTAWLRAAGWTLARLHDEATFVRSGTLALTTRDSSSVPTTTDEPAGPAVGDDALGSETQWGSGSPEATWPVTLDAQLAVYEDALVGTGYADVAGDAREFVTTHAERFALPDAWRPSLLHGWFSPKHVAVRDGRVACVVDFEHALVGSPEWD